MFTPGHREPGGAAKRSRTLAHELARSGWHVLAVTRSATTRRLRIERAGTLQEVEVPGFGLGRLSAVVYVAIAVVVGIGRARRARAFVAVQPSSPAIAAAICARAARRPLLVSFSTSGSLSELSLFRTRLGRLRRRLLRSGTFLAQTEVAAAEVRAALPDVDVAVLRSPVDVSPPPPLTDQPRVLYTGRFSSEKDLPMLLDVWERVGRRHAGATLTLAGIGGAYRSVEDVVRARADELGRAGITVELPGWIADVGDALAEHDVYVLTSTSEGMSNSLLEACAAGRVVVASAIGPNVELLGPGYPLLFEPSNPVALERALERALFDEDLRASCRAEVLERIIPYETSRVIADMEAILDAATHRPRHQL
jgi:glycosyltransferase involved in cell wall biosynthesis